MKRRLSFTDIEINDMKTIEERAKEYSLRDFDGFYTGMEKAVEEGYIAGAMEQKAIDDALLVNVWRDFVKMTDSIRRVYISDLLPKGGEK